MKILLIDNYDSFTYNLSHYLEDLGAEVTVWRNDEFELEDAAAFDKIVLSPGPGLPAESGLLMAVIRTYAATKSILGICLGQQAIAEAFGGSLVNLEKVYHGVSSNITITVADEPLFTNIGETMAVGRYHSWTVNRDLPDSLEATSTDEDGEIMSLRHRTLDVKGVQFHPESILTPNGKLLLKNWLHS
ncbi:aminodeoxychorismate/anthranilate synthase component II [Flavobacterium magnum]|uniref:Aminodeoxychorismate/anthranilate synthase component II n=1 Tax=Flavobacterium magnum TaxID=2162713 RepID=A0A2S0RJX8_9FLAO|nr:aminodeoxychorismate/anthranilate synthase component II [Flavobacterium magnum]AWA31451.1 aminodeoxychorismate/anthranilate synthase component II [Flavobacterium magnum]